MKTKPHARRNDPQTSRDAAESVEHLTTRQRAVEGIFTIYVKLHDERLIELYREFRDGYKSLRQTDSGIRSRRAELVRAGVLADSGERANTKAGRKSVVWKIV